RLNFTTGYYALFAQDEWKVMPRLSLTLGLRRENESFPSPQLPNALLSRTASLPNNKNNFDPRVGFACARFGHGWSFLRGGAGMSFARAINSTLYQALIGTGAAGSQTNPNINPNTSCAPIFPQVVPASKYSTCLGGASGNTT